MLKTFCKYFIKNLSSLNNNVAMVDILNKKCTNRSAIAMATIKLPIKVLEEIKEKRIKKGDVFSVSEIAGIMGAKKTAEILPLCHPIQTSGVKIGMKIDMEKSCMIIEGDVKAADQRTGVEMEALVAVSIAALNIYDMCKYMSYSMTINDIKLIKKSGGKSDYKLNEI